jgi:hypothetical protein
MAAWTVDAAPLGGDAERVFNATRLLYVNGVTVLVAIFLICRTTEAGPHFRCALLGTLGVAGSAGLVSSLVCGSGELW